MKKSIKSVVCAFVGIGMLALTQANSIIAAEGGKAEEISSETLFANLNEGTQLFNEAYKKLVNALEDESVKKTSDWNIIEQALRETLLKWENLNNISASLVSDKEKELLQQYQKARDVWWGSLGLAATFLMSSGFATAKGKMNMALGSAFLALGSLIVSATMDYNQKKYNSTFQSLTQAEKERVKAIKTTFRRICSIYQNIVTVEGRSALETDFPWVSPTCQILILN